MIIVRTVENGDGYAALADIEIDGEWFDTSHGELEVYKDSDGEEVVAVFAPQAWVFARKEQNAEAQS